MTLIETLKNWIFGDNKSESYGPFNPPARKRVNIDKRSKILQESHGFDDPYAKSISECLAKFLNETQYHPRDISKCIQNNTDLNSKRAQEITNEQIGGVTKINTLSRYQKTGVNIGVEWMPPGDGDLSPVCDEIASEIESRGGAVAINSLYEIMRNAAENHKEGTPELVEYMIPHKGNCRCAISPVVGYSEN